MKKDNWLIYGATGVTGKLLAESAVRKGLKPVLGGRSAKKTSSLASKLGLNYEVFELKDKEKIGKILPNYKLVSNISGPHNLTAKILTSACLEHGVNYIDITGEIPVIENIMKLNKEYGINY